MKTLWQGLKKYFLPPRAKESSKKGGNRASRINTETDNPHISTVLNSYGIVSVLSSRIDIEFILRPLVFSSLQVACVPCLLTGRPTLVVGGDLQLMTTKEEVVVTLSIPEEVKNMVFYVHDTGTLLNSNHFELRERAV